MNTHPLPTASLQPYQQLAVRFALHRFFAHYHCPCPDHHAWHTDCLHEALYAVLRADTNEPPTTPSARGLEAEDDLLLAQDAEVQGLWVGLSEAERERVGVHGAPPPCQIAHQRVGRYGAECPSC